MNELFYGAFMLHNQKTILIPEIVDWDLERKEVKFDMFDNNHSRVVAYCKINVVRQSTSDKRWFNFYSLVSIEGKAINTNITLVTGPELDAHGDQFSDGRSIYFSGNDPVTEQDWKLYWKYLQGCKDFEGAFIEGTFAKGGNPGSRYFVWRKKHIKPTIQLECTIY